MKWENFTSDRILRLKCAEGKSQSLFWDGKVRGLGIRVTPNGVKSYIVQASLRNKDIRITIGNESNYTLEDARKIANQYKVQIDQGIDPRQVIRDKLETEKAELAAKIKAKAEQSLIEAINASRQSLIARTAWNEYLAAPHPTWSQVYRDDHEKVAREGGKPLKIGKKLSKAAPLSYLLSFPLHEITSSLVREWMERECATRATFAHNSLRKFKPFIAWCAEHKEYKHVVQANCCLTKEVKEVTPSNKTKDDDCLQKEQLTSWFAAVKKINNPVISAYLQALLLTGARRNELAALKWSDIDFQWNTLKIRDKVEGARTIPLTPYVSHLLVSLPRRNEFVFSSPTADSGRLIDPHKAHNQALQVAGLPHVTLHGLRRSLNTLSEWVEAPVGVVAQIIGHKPSAISEKHYKRRPIDLLRMWHTKIESWILEEAQIEFVPMRVGLRAI